MIYFVQYLDIVSLTLLALFVLQWWSRVQVTVSSAVTVSVWLCPSAVTGSLTVVITRMRRAVLSRLTVLWSSAALTLTSVCWKSGSVMETRTAVMGLMRGWGAALTQSCARETYSSLRLLCIGSVLLLCIDVFVVCVACLHLYYVCGFIFFCVVYAVLFIVFCAFELVCLCSVLCGFLCLVL